MDWNLASAALGTASKLNSLGISIAQSPFYSLRMD